MSGARTTSTPQYDEHVLSFPRLVKNYRSRYPKAQGWDKYMLGRKAAEYSSYLVDLEFGLHQIVLSGRHYSVCSCGLQVKDFASADGLPVFLKTPGHLDIKQEPTSIFFYFKYLAPQHRILYLACQNCDVVEEVAPRETSVPRTAPTHNCQSRIDSISFEI
jgi:hypothetical protein